MDFCSAINVDIRHLLNTPAKVKGRRLRVRTKRSYCDVDGTTHWYSDIVGFLPYGTDAERNTELGMDMIPHSGVKAQCSTSLLWCRGCREIGRSESTFCWCIPMEMLWSSKSTVVAIKAETRKTVTGISG